MRTEYILDISANCPVNGKIDWYECRIRSSGMVKVEDILEATSELANTKVYQEELTTMLASRLNATVETSGFHSGVKTVVICGDQ